MYLGTVFIHIEARTFISYKRYLSRCLYEPFHILHMHSFTFEHLISAFIQAGVYEPCFYLDKYSMCLQAR